MAIVPTNDQYVHNHIGDSTQHPGSVTLAADADVLLDITGQVLSLDSQQANYLFGGPVSGGAADPVFRVLVDADIPSGIARDSEVTTAISTHAGEADPHTGYLKESNTIGFLVSTATAELGGEIVVGATPGGELGGTWDAPTVDATHSGSAHSAYIPHSLATAANDFLVASGAGVFVKKTLAETKAIFVAGDWTVGGDLTFTGAATHRIKGVAGQQLHIAPDGTASDILIGHLNAAQISLGGVSTTTYPALILHHATVHTFELGSGVDLMTLNATGLGIGIAPSYRLHVETSVAGLAYPLKIGNNAGEVANYASGILFSVEGGGDEVRGKGALVYALPDPTLGWNRGSFYFLQNTAASAAIPTLSNVVMIISNAGAVRMNAYGAGAATFDASGNITSVSDERLKTAIRPLPYGLREVLQLKPIAYHYSAESGLDTEYEYGGFGAGAVAVVMPLAVGMDGQGYKTLADRPILGAVVNALEEIDRRLQTLEGMSGATVL